MDLAQWFRDKRWVAILELIDGLPSASRYSEALLNDPEAAAYLAEQPKPNEDWSPRSSEYTLTANLLREILHAIMSLKQTQIGLAGGSNSGGDKPFPAPVNELDRILARMERQWVEDFAALLGYSPEDI